MPAPPALLFLHGVRLSGAMWDPQRRLLAGEFPVLTPDLPGHGRLHGRSFSFAAAIDAVGRVLAEAGARSCVVVGLSLGGYVAMEAMRARPEWFLGAVLSGCTREHTGPATAWHRGLAALCWGWPEPSFAHFNATLFRALYPPTIAESIIAGGFYPRAVSDAVTELRGRRFLPALAGFPKPVLLLNGRWDIVFRRDEDAFRRAAQHARLAVLPRAAHLANLDQPRAFAAEVAGFARSVAPRADAVAAG